AQPRVDDGIRIQRARLVGFVAAEPLTPDTTQIEAGAYPPREIHVRSDSELRAWDERQLITRFNCIRAGERLTLDLVVAAHAEQLRFVLERGTSHRIARRPAHARREHPARLDVATLPACARDIGEESGDDRSG